MDVPDFSIEMLAIPRPCKININEDEGGKAQPSGVKKKQLLHIIVQQGCHKNVEKWSCKCTK